MWALVATFIKATTDTLTQFGVGGTFVRWPVYALVVGSVAALFLQQASLHVGPLRASQPFLVMVDPIVSITLAMWIFGEHFTDNAAALAAAAAGFAVMCAGVVLLTQTAPATMAADTPDGQEGGAQRGTASRRGRPTASGFTGHLRSPVSSSALAPTLSSGELRIPRRTGRYANGRTIPTTRVIPAASASQLKGRRAP